MAEWCNKLREQEKSILYFCILHRSIISRFLCPRNMYIFFQLWKLENFLWSHHIRHNITFWNNYKKCSLPKSATYKNMHHLYLLYITRFWNPNSIELPRVMCASKKKVLLFKKGNVVSRNMMVTGRADGQSKRSPANHKLGIPSLKKTEFMEDKNFEEYESCMDTWSF